MADVGDIITRKVSELLLLPGNPRRISKTDMERLMASIRKYDLLPYPQEQEKRLSYAAINDLKPQEN